MLPFRTTLSPFKPGFEIDHSHKMMCLGSCFAQHMAQRLTSFKFSCTSNPFGILYNPQNIANSLEMICNEYQYSEKDIVERDGHWFSLWHHSQFHNQNASSLIATLQSEQAIALAKLKSTDLFIFTFGTAYYYQHLATGAEVANCHKLPANQFEKKRSTVDEITGSFSAILKRITALHSKAKFIFTVSPIRHIKDGITENTKSKAILHLAIEELTSTIKDAHYFPSYELLMDDLRDYRFYDSDLLHPTELAVDYIWNHFQQYLLSPMTHQTNKRINTIQSAISHRAFHPESEAHQKFLYQTLEKIALLESNHANLDFSTERKRVTEGLVKQ